MNKPSCFSRSKAFSWPFISLHLLLLLLSLHSVDSLRLYPHGAPRRGRREKEEKRQGAQDGVVIVEEEPETSHKLARAFFQGDFKDNATAQGIYSLLQSSQLSQRKEDEYKDEQESVTFFPGESSDRQGFRKGLSQEDLYRGDDRPTGNGLHSTTYNQISAHGVHTPEVLYGEVAAKDNGWGREEEKTTEAKPVRSPHEQSFIVSPHGHTPSSTSRRREQAVSSFPTMNPPPLEKGKSLLSRDGSSSALEESSLDGDYPGLSLTEEEASAGSGDVEGKKGKSLSSPQPDSLAFLGGTSFSEQNPPRLPLEISEKATPQLSSREEQVQRAAALPLCEISSSVLGNLLGSGTYGGVYPLVKTSPCSSITRDFVAKKFAVKIFRLRKEGMMELFDDLEEGSVPSLTNLKDSVITAIKGELNSLPFSSSTYQELIRLVDPSIDLNALKTLGSTLKAPDVLANFKILRAAINTRCFFQELGETGMIFSQLEHFFATFRPQMWASLKGATKEARASKYAEVGLAQYHWSLPLARVISKDAKGNSHWGLLVELFQGDLQPKGDKTGLALDGWDRQSSGNRNLRKIFTSRDSLLDLTSKSIKPFVLMHNLYRFGHFDIKPPNLLYKYYPAEKGRSARVEVAAGDFGMATLLFQETKIRGTLPFMAPEMEKPKDKTDPQKKLVLLASPAFDTYALGFTLSALWTSGTEYTERYSWVTQCIRPSMTTSGQSFTFQQFSSREGALVYDEKVRQHLTRCMKEGGKVDKLYHVNMPLLIRIKIQQMTDIHPQARVSLRHIRFFFKTFGVLDRLQREPSRSDGRDMERTQEKLSRLQQLQLVQFLLFYLRMKPLTAVKDNLSEYKLLNQTLLDLARGEPIHEAVSQTISPLPLSSFREIPVGGDREKTDAPVLSTLVAVKDEEISLVSKQVRGKITRDAKITEDQWNDLLDTVFGVSAQGFNVLVSRAAIERKAYQLSKEIGKAIKEYFHTQYYKVEGNTQLISEDVTPKSIEHVYTSLRISPPPEGSELSHFILQRIDRSYVAWGTVDRLLRQALRLAVETNPSSSVQHVYQALQLGEEPSPENLQSFYSTIYSTFESLASQIYYRLPWESIESQAHYGISAKSMENYLRNTYIPLIAKMFPYAVQRRLLGFLVSRGVTSMKGKLPEASNLRDIYEKVMGSMAGDTHQPLPFLFSFEREEYTRILYNWTLTEFKENVVYRATRHELKLAIQTAITQLDKELGSMSLSDIQQKVQTSLLPKYLREASPARYGWTSDKLNEKIKHITQKAVERQQSISVDMTETVLRVNGRSIPAKRADMKAHSILKKATVFPNDLTCLQLNQFFTNLLKESFDPKCRRFVAQLKRLTRPSPAEYEAVPSNVKLVDLFTSRDKAIFKLVAVSLTDAKTEGATSEPNNCFLWTPDFLKDQKILVKAAGT